MSILIFPKTEIVRSVNRTKITRAPCRRRNGEAVPRAEKIWWLDNSRPQGPKRQLRVSKQSSTRSRGTGSGWSMDPGVSVQKQNFTRNPEKLAKVPGTREETKSHLHWHFLGIRQSLWRSLLESLHVYTTSETNSVAERAVRRVKEGTSAELLQSGLKESWWADSLECYTYLRNVTDLSSDGKTLHERRFGQPLEGPIIPFGSLVEYHPKTEGSVKNPSVWKESFTWIVPRIRSVRGWNLEGWRTDRRPWGVGNDGRIGNLLEKTQCERGDISQTRRIYFFQSQMDESKSLEEIRNWEHPPWYGRDQFKERVILDFLGEPEGSLPQPHDSFPDAGEATNDFWSMSGSFMYRHHVEPRVKLHSPREESFPIPLKYIDVTRTTHTNLDVKQEKRIDDCWNIDGSRDLSDPWTGFTLFTLLEEKTSWRACVVRVETNEETAYIQARSSMARALEINGKNKSHDEIDVVQDIDSVPSNVQSANREALLCVFEDNEAAIKMIMKGRSPTMRHVSRTHRVALDWLFDRINLDPKIQIKYIDTKNQLADILTKGEFHTWWVESFVDLVHRSDGKTSSTRIRKRTCHSQIETFDDFDRKNAFVRVFFSFIIPGEDLTWISRSWKICSWRSNGATCGNVKIRLFTKGLWSSWSSQEWKSAAGERDRSGKPEENSWDSLQEVDLIVKNIFSAGLRIQQGTKRLFTIEWGNLCQRILKERLILKISLWAVNAAEFVNKVRNQVRIRQKRMSSIAESGEEHSIIWGMFMVTTMNAAIFMGKNFSTIQSVVKNHESLTLKQMFDVTAQIVNNKEEINGLDKILYQKNSWTHLSLINDPVIINLQSTKVYVFSHSVLCLGKVLQHPECNEAWKNRIAGERAERSYRDYDGIDGESTEFERNIFPGFTTLQLCDRISDLLSSLGQTPESFTGRILFMSMFNDIFCDRYDNKDECLRNANIVKTFAGRFGIGQWSFIGPGSEKKWYPSENSPHGAWDHVAEEMLLLFAESGHPIFRSTTPLSRGQLKSKGKGKVSIHFTADQDTVDTIYCIILSVKQFSVYGAVAAICEEFEDHQDRTGQPVMKKKKKTAKDQSEWSTLP